MPELLRLAQARLVLATNRRHHQTPVQRLVLQLAVSGEPVAAILRQPQ
jgi:hypothetical protein